MPVDRRTIWKRRAVLMAVVGVIIGVPLTLVLRGGEEDPGDNDAPVAEAPRTGDVKVERKLGVRFRLPDGWRRKTKDGIMSLRRRDNSILIAVSAPGPAQDVKPIQAQAIAAVKGQFRKVEVVDRTNKGRLGGRPASTAAISARHPKKKADIQILVSTAKGKNKAYLVEIFASGASPDQALAEAQVALNNLRLTG